MGFWDRFRGIDPVNPAQRVLPDGFESFISTGGIPVMDPGTPLENLRAGRSGVAGFWGSQPNVRKVVDFIARNASIPMHVYDRRGDADRRRVTSGDLADLMRNPRPGTGAFRFWHSVHSDGLLYDRWCLLIERSPAGALSLVQVPSWRLSVETDPLRRVKSLRFWAGDKAGASDQWVDIDPDQAIYDFGYAPNGAGLSPLETLRDILDESAEAVAYRREVWAAGVRGDEYIKRPQGVPWTPETRERFAGDMKRYQQGGSQSGGVPVLEDGMEFAARRGFKPQELADLEGRRLTAIEVASAFHIAPELVGAQQGNYSNVREYRQMLYRDSLGPYIKAIEDTLNAQLVPKLAPTESGIYIEANIESKLRGSFEEQAQIMSTATGAPWVTRNESRARMNMPPVDGGDELVTPLNVLVGGQASPRDSAPKATAPHSMKAAPTEGQSDQVVAVLRRFFKRQGAAVLSAVGAEGAGGEWWDGDRWDRELSADVLKVSHTVAALLGAAEAKRLGFDDAYDPDLTVEFLTAVAQRYASTINATTRSQVQASLDDTEADPADVFAAAESVRAAGAGSQIAVFVAGFATTEAARQIARAEGVEPTKTWITGVNPRSEHAAMDGETVGIEDTFSNGQPWPGSGGGLDDVGCNCSVEIDIP